MTNLQKRLAMNSVLGRSLSTIVGPWDFLAAFGFFYFLFFSAVPWVTTAANWRANILQVSGSYASMVASNMQTSVAFLKNFLQWAITLYKLESYNIEFE